MSDSDKSSVIGIFMVIIIILVVLVFLFTAVRLLNNDKNIEQNPRAVIEVQDFDNDILINVETLDNSDFIFITGFNKTNLKTDKNAFYIRSSGDYRLETLNNSNVSFYVVAVIGEEFEVMKNFSYSDDSGFANLKSNYRSNVQTNRIRNFD